MPDFGLLGGGGSGGGWGDIGSGGFGGAGWGDIIRGGIDLASRYLSLPEGTDIDLPGYDLGRGDPMSTAAWTQGGAGYRQLATMIIPSPDGKLGFWKAAGRPVLFAGDLAACKRVQRVASRASRAVGRRRGGR